MIKFNFTSDDTKFLQDLLDNTIIYYYGIIDEYPQHKEQLKDELKTARRLHKRFKRRLS